MKIGINALAVGHGMTGIGSYTLSLVNALAEFGDEHSYCLITARPWKSLENKRNWQQLVVEKMDRWWEELHLPGELSRWGVDLYHSPFFTCPIVDEIPSVITIHDMIPEKRPDLCSRELLAFYKARIYPAVRAVRQIITTSEFSRREIIETLKVEPEKVHVVYQGISPEFHPAQAPGMREGKNRWKLPEKYILYVGILDERKNLRRLISAFGQIVRKLPDVYLVMAGRKDNPGYSLVSTIEEAGIQGRILETGYVLPEDLPGLYAGAGVFAFPSLYEGFGRPVVEAMASGVPVVAANTTSLPEIAGEAALLVNPHETASLSKALLQAWEDKALRKKLQEQGLKRAEHFTYRKFAERLLDFYRQWGK